MNSAENRKHSRVASNAKVEVFTGAKKTVQARCRDIGLGGVYVKMASDMKIGDLAHIKIADGAQYGIGKVVRKAEDGLAIKFLDRLRIESGNRF